MNKKILLNFPLSTGSYSSFIEYIMEIVWKQESSIICVANVHMFIEAYKNKSFLQIINNAELVTPDGQPLVWALKLLYGIKQDRVAGMNLLPDLLCEMEKKGIAAYFYGSTEPMLNNSRIYLEKNYPKLKIAGFNSPPFDTLVNPKEKEIISTINNSFPCIVFVVLGCPKQEKWMASMKSKINGVIIGIGGALPVLIGMQKRAPVWMQKSALEWLFRLSQEPKRLYKRYTKTNSLFLWIFIKEYIKVKVLIPLYFLKSKK